MKMNKRGVSEVVITVMIILVTISLFFVLAQMVIPFVRDNLQKSTECVAYKDIYKFQETFESLSENYNYNCKNAGKYGISIKSNGPSRTDVAEPKGFIVVFSDGVNKESVEINNSAPVGRVRMLDSSKTSLIIPEKGGIQTYVYNSSNLNFIEMEIHPVLQNSRFCEASDTIKIQSCSGGVII